MSATTVIPPAGGEVVGDSAERRVEILCDHDALHATWSRFAPGRDGADLHIHRRHTDFFYVLEGELTVRLGLEDEPVSVPAGTLARVPPLVVHGFRNGSDAEVRYLNFHAPGQGFADFMRALRRGRELSYDQEPPPDDGIRPATEAVIGGGELVADGPDARVVLLADVDALSISVVTVRSGATPPLADHDGVQWLYVLEGDLAGSWAGVPPGGAEAVSWSSSDAARFLRLRPGRARSRALPTAVLA